MFNCCKCFMTICQATRTFVATRHSVSDQSDIVLEGSNCMDIYCLRNTAELLIERDATKRMTKY